VAANSSNTIAHFAAGLFPLRERVWWSQPASLTACSYQRPSAFRVVAVRSCPGTRGVAAMKNRRTMACVDHESA
jgi:hypothetical protein